MKPWSRDLSGCTFPLNRRKNAGRERSGEKHSCSTLHNPRAVWIWIGVIWISLKPWSSVSLRVYITSQQWFLCPVSSLIIRREGGKCCCRIFLYDYLSGCVETGLLQPFLMSCPRWITLSARRISASADKGSVTSGLSHHQRLSWFESSASVWWRAARDSARVVIPGSCSVDAF